LETNNDLDDDNGPLVQTPDEQKLEPKKNKPAPFWSSSRLYIPSALRKEFMSLAHSTHIGLGGCLRRLRECMFWPGMSAQMKDLVSKYDVCLTHRNSQVQEPLLQHEVPFCLLAKVSADMFSLRPNSAGCQ